MLKYSIIIPAYNGMPYLKTCVESVISQGYNDYELILSEDHSVDGTSEYIDSLTDSHIVKLHCPERTSMSEHWEWALSHASGEWQIFVGQDDALQPYFFRLADKLVSICNKKRLSVIMSERAYYFWPGCEDTYGDIKVFYGARKIFKTLKTEKEMKKALCIRRISYMDLPSMYTTSLFKKTFVDFIKDIQGGRVFTTHPQDANLAALAVVFQKKYLKSYIPLGWVGSSPKSAGLAIANFGNPLSKDYLNVTNSSELKLHNFAGDFKLASCPIYFWGALLTIAEKHNLTLYKRITKNSFKKAIFSLAQLDITEKNNALFNELLILNGLKQRDLSPMWVRKKVNTIDTIISEGMLFIKSLRKSFYYKLKQNGVMNDFMNINDDISIEINKRKLIQ